MTTYDIILRNGLIVDGSGGTPYRGDLAIQGDRIAAVGDLGEASGLREIDVHGLAIAPGFINMLSWSNESLIEDGRSMSEIRQGVTLEVMGEGTSMGPLSPAMKEHYQRGILGNPHIQYTLEWNTLGEYLEWLEARGVSCNIASFIGSATVREYAVGLEDREVSEDEHKQMAQLVHEAMRQGAMGLSAALIYPPATYQKIVELIDLATVVAEYDGLYISHIRGEGAALIDALNEFIETVDVAWVRGEVYHLKAAGAGHWDKMDEAIALIQEVRDDGLDITADMYPYPFSGTGLTACIPPWAHDGGFDRLLERLADPEQRGRIKADMATSTDVWENMYLENGPDNIQVCGLQSETLRPLNGKRLSQIAAERATAPDDTLLDLILEDRSRVSAMYFCMSEENLRKQMALPWVSFCSDEESQATEGVFLKIHPHPRAYGAFARVLGKYVRDEQIIPLEEAVRRLTAFPAANLRIAERGSLQAGYFADVVVFDPATIQDHATPENPHQYATGVQHVFVNGVAVLQDGEHTGAKPGRVVRGPGYQRQPFEFDYPAALHPLLKLGADYGGTYFEFERDQWQVADLIRMVKDRSLLALPYETRAEAFAPLHASHVLAQMKAYEAVPDLLDMLNALNPLVARDLPTVFKVLGAPALPGIVTFLEASLSHPLARMAAVNCLVAVGDYADELTRYTISALLIKYLRDYNTNDRFFNTALVSALVRIESVGAIDLIEEVLDAGAVFEEMLGPREDIYDKLGIPVLDDEDDEDEPESPEPMDWIGSPVKSTGPKKPGKDAAREKAKRKQAAKLKKQQRKKR